MKKIFGVFICLMLGIGLVAAPNAGATAYDPTGVPGSPPMQSPTAMINNHGMLGDFLIGNFYRAVVNDKFFNGSNVATYVSIENVSPKYWVAAHVRLRSGRYSIEVLDFPILLSPNDVFWFQFQAIPDGKGGLKRVEIISTDKKTIEYSGLNTLSALPGATVNYENGVLTMSLNNNILQSFKSIKNDEYKSLNETTQGYIEVIGLFAIKRVNNMNFYGLMKALWTDTKGAALPGAAGKYASIAADEVSDGNTDRVPAVDVAKYLGGHVFVGDFQTGLYMGYTMTAIKDFRAGVGTHRDLCIRGPNNAGGVLVNPATILYNYTDISSVDAAYTAPDWATDFGPTANDGDSEIGPQDMIPGACKDYCSKVQSFSLDEFDNALYKDTVYSTFFNTGFSGKTFSMLSLLAPTKFLHWFYDSPSGLNGWSQATDNCWPVGKLGPAYSVREKLWIDDIHDGIGKICVNTNGFWDQEEKTIGIPSPGAPFNLPYELNFLPVGYESYQFMEDFCFLVPTELTPFWFYAKDAKAGRFKLDHFTYCDGYYGGDPRVTDSSYGCELTADQSEDQYGGSRLMPCGELPVLALGMDIEATNYPHARMFETQWDNPATCGGKLGYDGEPVQ